MSARGLAGLALLALAPGCGGANDETVVDELRVMAIVADPPEVAPGSVATVTATVADPTAVDADVMLWTCTNLGDGCLEAAVPGQGAVVGKPAAGQISTVAAAPAEFAAVVGDGTTVLPVLVWALACAPGVCPIIDLAAAQPEAGSADADALSAFLADPYSAAADLPLTDTSLALGQVGVSMRAAPTTNPVLTPPDGALTVRAGGYLDLAIGVDAAGASTAYGYATLGGFGATAYDVVDGGATLRFFAPEDAGTAELWIVVNGEDGGSAIWHTEATVTVAP